MEGQIRTSRRSPAIIVAVLALVAALAGTAIAGQEASTSALSKKQVKRIATKQINKLAPGLSVAHAENATNAQNANAVGGIPPSQIGAVGRTNFEPGFCADDNHNGTNCTSVELDLPRSARVFVTASASYYPDAFDDPSGGDFTDRVEGLCRITLDGVEIGAYAYLEIRDSLDEDSLALNRVTPPLDPGTHTLGLRCTEQDGVIVWDQASISAVMLGSG